jgi:hypothetical protein
VSARPLERRVQGLAEERDRRYFAELVIELERRIDVNAIRVGSLRLWPLMRWQLARGIKAVQSESAVARRGKVRSQLALARQQAGLQERFWSRLDRILRPGASARAMQHLLRDKTDDQMRALRAVGPVDYVVASKGEKYYQQAGGRRYAPITDPVYEDLTRYGRAVPLALEPMDFECVHPPLKIDIEPHMWRTRGMPKPLLPEIRRSVDHINAILADLAPQFRLDADGLINRYARYVRKEAFFRQVVEILQPKALFYSSFTGWAPLTWACRNLGIPTIDIQHGGQSSYHYLTTHWTKVPAEGYELMPDYFWCWSETNRRFIEPWLPGGARRHVPLVGGNRNVATWKRSGEASLSPAEREELARLRAKDKVILVTLGYSVEDILPPPLVEAAARRPQWTWLFRLHPLHRGPSTVESVRRQLADAGVADAEVDMPTQHRLHALLTAAHHHVTPFSTAGREALAFGVPTLIVHPIGRTYFADEIEAGTFRYADSADEIVAQLSVARARTPDGRYIESDDALVDALMRRIHSDRGYGEPRPSR